MNSLKNLFYWLSLDDGRNKLRNSYALLALNQAEVKQQRNNQTNAKSGSLTPEQLTEVLNWLSLY